MTKQNTTMEPSTKVDFGFRDGSGRAIGYMAGEAESTYRAAYEVDARGFTALLCERAGMPFVAARTMPEHKDEARMFRCRVSPTRNGTTYGAIHFAYAPTLEALAQVVGATMEGCRKRYAKKFAG